MVILPIVIIISSPFLAAALFARIAVFSYRNLDALQCKLAAERCALTYAGKLLGREHLERIAEVGGQYWGHRSAIRTLLADL